MGVERISNPLSTYIAFNTSVPTNGTLSVPLNYGGPFNMSNFNIQQGPIGTPDSSFYTSGLFNIQRVDGVEPQTWGGVFRTAATQSSVPTSNSGITTSAPSSTSTPSSSLPPRILAPVLTFLILFFFAAILLSTFLFLKRRRYNALLLQYQTIVEERGNAHVGRHAIATEKDAFRGELQGPWQGYELDAGAENEAVRGKAPDKGEEQASNEMG